METGDILRIECDARGIATFTMNRPEVSNAFNDELIASMIVAFDRAAGDEGVRAVFLTGAGKHFSAGADLNWMRRMAGYTRQENLADAKKLSRLMHTIHEFPKPVTALVNGAAIGGGAGLVACCDIAIASSRAVFALSEVNLGLIPAVVSPYVVAAIGRRAAKRYFQTGERIDAAEALRLGFVHEVCEPDALNERRDRLASTLSAGGPVAQHLGKHLVDRVANAPIDQALRDELAGLIADLRGSVEAQEGMKAFLEKREPAWRKHV